MLTIKSSDEEKRWRCLLSFMAAALLFFYLICPAAPARWADLYSSYGKAAIFAMAALYFYKCGISGAVEVKLVIAYTVWMFISRLLCSDLYLQNELDLVISRILCCVIFPIGMKLDGKERERLLDVVIAVSGAFFFVTALLSLYACIFGVFFYIPPEHSVFGRDNNFFGAGFNYIVAWDTNRTISASWFYIAWCMMVYEFFHCRKKLWRIPIVIASLVFFLAVDFCYCRSVKLIICLNIAMLLLLLGIKYIKLKKPAQKVLVLVLIAAVSLPLSYKSFDAALAVSAKAYNALDVDIERTSDQFLGTNYQARIENGQTFEDTRDLKESISTGSGRLEIFRAAVPAIKNEPLRLITGKLTSKVMLGVNDVLRQSPTYLCDIFHMHNYLLQTLMLTGIIGFALVLAFTVFLVIRMVKLFFRDSVSMSVKCLTLPLSGILVYGMFETVIFTNCADKRSAMTDFRELFFFFLAGILFSYYYETFSADQKD